MRMSYRDVGLRYVPSGGSPKAVTGLSRRLCSSERVLEPAAPRQGRRLFEHWGLAYCSLQYCRQVLMGCLAVYLPDHDIGPFAECIHTLDRLTYEQLRHFPSMAQSTPYNIPIAELIRAL